MADAPAHADGGSTGTASDGPWGSLGEHCLLKILDGVGGGRGVVAAHAIKPGTLVMAEEPIVQVPKTAGGEVDLHAALARRILVEISPEERRKALEAAAHLHPVKAQDIPEPQLSEQRERLSETVSRLIAQGDHGLGPEEVLRLLLALQCNAFYSGLYLNLALINHSCSPNCTKLTPWKEVQRAAQGRGGSGGCASEVWATRSIAPGEEVTISYLQPVEQSAPRRYRQFLEQHLCDLGLSPHPLELEVFLPEMAEDAGANEQLQKLEDDLESLDGRGSPDSIDELRRILGELRCLVGPRHLAAARAHAMLIKQALDILEQQDDPSPSLAIEIAGWCLELLETQELLIGPDHPDVGATCSDIADALDFLLGAAPKQLFAAFPKWGDFPKASKAQHQFQQRAKKIAKMFGQQQQR